MTRISHGQLFIPPC